MDYTLAKFRAYGRAADRLARAERRERLAAIRTAVWGDEKTLKEIFRDE